MSTSPIFRYCPHCTHELIEREVYGKGRQVCPNCGYIHFVDPKVAALALITQESAEPDGTMKREVLLIKRGAEPEKGRWALPAGFIDRGEDPKAAAAREVAEETGLIVTIHNLLGVFFDGSTTIAIAYAAQVIGGTLCAQDDADAVGWFSPDALPDLAFESTHTLIAAWLAH